MLVSAFSASRWTTACREWEGGGPARELGEGRCKNKAEKAHKRKWGEVSLRKLKFLWRKNAIETISSFAERVCERELLAYKAYNLVMGL